ncbi:glycosyltransferase [Janthinobacterium fluminis]|nr:glycosyltransferase [Janthinobacterium fluminis]
MIGTAYEGRGGVAAVIEGLRQAGFFERHQVYFVATHADSTRWTKLRMMLAAVWRVLYICLRHRPGIVHVHTSSRASFARKSLLLAIARACGRKTVLHLHGGGFREYAQIESGPLLRWWIRRTLSRSSAVVTLSDSWSGFVREYAPQARTWVVSNSVPVPPVGAAAAEAPARLLFLGRAERDKGVFDLLEAMAVLVPEFPALQLALGGDGDLAAVERSAARLQIGGHVSLLGWVGPEQRDAELARATVFVLPSYHEGLPMAMLEAMAAGKAVVVTPVGAIPEAVSAGENGLLVQPGDVAALAGALRALLADAALRARLGHAARATVLARYSTEAALARLAALYRELGLREGA